MNVAIILQSSFCGFLDKEEETKGFERVGNDDNTN